MLSTIFKFKDVQHTISALEGEGWGAGEYAESR